MILLLALSPVVLVVGVVKVADAAGLQFGLVFYDYH